ncbi:retropepsin-like aspartic protease [Flavobacterium oreochromis]|uniref:retropepsin-like aspartic protease n=1 Tax=Flavobacterium oreochromis TaxID=2906078 RepID=UPI003858139D
MSCNNFGMGFIKTILFVVVLFSKSTCLLGQESSHKDLIDGVQKEIFKKEIPFSYIRKHIFIEVELDQKKYHFLFDTGYERCAIHNELISVLKYKKNEKKATLSGSSFDKPIEVEYITLPLITIEGINFYDNKTVSQDLSFIQKHYPELKISGIIGYNLMRKVNWEINYREQKIKFTNDKELPVAQNAIPVPFFNANRIPKMHTKIDAKKIDFIFDTGSSGSITINKRHIEAIIGNDTEKVEKKGDDLEYTCKEFKLDKILIKNQKLTFETKASNLIGNGFLQNYLVTLIPKTNTIYLTPNAID